jgi:DNA invertase Pin-like site-specific DNA recombinase
MIHGYARVSTSDQDLSIQLEALRRSGADVIHQEKRSGTTKEGRAALAGLLSLSSGRQIANLPPIIVPGKILRPRW